jgi:hypothetical protein
MDYSIPAEGASDLDDCRLHHDDLRMLTHRELDRERCRVIVAIAACESNAHALRWLQDRFEAIEAERSTRNWRKNK